MQKAIIRTEQAPKPAGHYSQAVVAGGFAFTAGLAGVDPGTGQFVPGGIEPQVRQTLKNMKAILEAAGTSLGNVVKVTVYLRNFDDFVIYNQVYGDYFDAATAPARTTVEVSRFPGEMAVEIDAIALMPEG